MGGAAEEGSRARAQGARRARLATDDFTIEVLSDILQSSTKVLLRSDELATMLGAYERYQRPARSMPAGRTCWRCTTAGHGGSIVCTAARCSSRTGRPCRSATYSPPRSAQLVSGLSDDGLLQRFMIVMPPRVEHGDPDDDDIADRLDGNRAVRPDRRDPVRHAPARDPRTRRKAGVLQGRGMSAAAPDPAAAVPAGRADRGGPDPAGTA